MRRTYIGVTLELTHRWRVGASGTTDSSRRPIVRDPHDETRPREPSTSLVGSLRRAAGEQAAPLLGPDYGDTERIQRSPWWVLGGELRDAGSVTERQRAPIQRRRGVSGGLFTNEEVEPGGTMMLYLRGDDVDVAPMLDLLQRWTPTFGGDRSVGCGVARVARIRHRTLDTASEDDLVALASATGGGPCRVEELLASGATTVTVKRGRDTDGGWRVRVPVGAMVVGEGPRTWGSQAKGMLRSRVEMIARSVGVQVCDLDEDRNGCGTCEVCEAFGSVHGSGALVFADAPWSGSHLDNPLEWTRIAINRITAGVRDSATFSVQFHLGVTVELEIGVREGRRVSEWMRVALLLAIRDLADGLVGFGRLWSAGFGVPEDSTRVTVTEAGRAVELENLVLPELEESA